MDEQKHIDESTLLSYFIGNLTPLQKQEVEEWLAASEENRKMARDVQYICLATETLDTIHRTNAPKALGKVKKRLHTHRPVSLFTWVQRIAAVMILPLLGTTLYFMLKKEPIEYVEIRTNPGMVATVNLPDGTMVWLNSRSSLKHPNRFTGETRDVTLDGEAYFSVHKDRSKPFIVNTPFQIKAEVLGTEFNMEAYQVDSTVRTTLVSGSVRLSYLAQNNKQESFLMKPDEEFVYNHKNRETQVDKPFIPTQTAWKDGLVIFRNTSFEEALKVLSKRFNVEFIVKNDKLYENSFTGPFDGQHLQLILEHFRLSSDIQYKFIDPEVGKGANIKEKTIVELY